MPGQMHTSPSTDVPSRDAGFPTSSATPAVEDPRRLAVLHRTGLLDTKNEEVFDRLTRLAVKLLDVPSAFISLVDETRDFYKSAQGFAEPLATRRVLHGKTFCHYAVEKRSPLVINDTAADPVYREVPTVRTLGVAAYVGVPIIVEGEAIGSFCVIDMKPRLWSRTEVEILVELAAAAEREIELRVANGDLMRARDEAWEAREAAERARQFRDDMLAVVAHDLRNPVQTVAMAASLLLELPLSEEQQKRHLAMIKRATQGMNTLIQDLLDVSRIEAGRFEVRQHPLPVGALLADVVEQFEAQAGAKELTLALDLSRGDGTVRGDRDRLLQVFSNLIGNAIKFTAQGGTITVSACPEEAVMRFSVADTGVGLSPEALTHVFDRFWQADRASRAGAGLGLAIVKGIVDAHGGDVSVASELGKGTTFTFTIPVAGRAPTAGPV